MGPFSKTSHQQPTTDRKTFKKYLNHRKCARQIIILFINIENMESNLEEFLAKETTGLDASTDAMRQAIIDVVVATKQNIILQKQMTAETNRFMKMVIDLLKNKRFFVVLDYFVF